MKLKTDLGAYVPSQSRANDSCTEEIVPCLVVAQHDAKVFGDVVKQDLQGML